MDFLAPIQNSIHSLDLVLRTHHSIPEIPNLLNRTVLLGGKRLRPALCFLMGQALHVSAHKMEPFARAAEFTHSASLAHDDVVDSANTRRHQRTINAQSSNKKAVLAGDLLLARVMVELSQQGDVDIIQDLSLVVEDLVNGEWLQMDLRGKTETSPEQLIEVSKRKTASLMAWCCKVAARLSPQSTPELLTLASDFGENLGIAFQIMDDVIDFSSHGEKDYAKDIKEGLVNYVIADVLKHSPHLKSQVQSILGQAETQHWPWTEEDLLLSVENMRAFAKIYLDKASESLAELKRRVTPITPNISVLPSLSLSQETTLSDFTDVSLLQKSQESFESLEALIAYMILRQN